MAGDSVTIRMPRWLVMAIVAIVLVGGGLGAGLILGGGDDAKVSAGKRSSTSTSTSTTTLPFLGVAPADDGGGGNDGGNEGGGNNGGGAAPVAPEPVAPAEPEVPAATADVSKTGAGVCPTVVTWEGHGGTRGYTLQVYNFAGNVIKYNGPVAGAGSQSYDCAAGVPTVGLVRLNTNTDTGTVSDSAP